MDITVSSCKSLTLPTAVAGVREYITVSSRDAKDTPALRYAVLAKGVHKGGTWPIPQWIVLSGAFRLRDYVWIPLSVFHSTAS